MTVRKNIAALILAAAVGISAAAALFPKAREAAAEGNTVNVWLIGGQSNAVGYAQGSPTTDTDERYTTGFDSVLFWGDYETDLSCPTGFVPVTTGLGKGYSGGTRTSGAELGIASALADSGEMQAVIKCAYGATFLYPDTSATVSGKVGTWTPPSWLARHPEYETGKVGDCYDWFLNTVRTGLEKLEALGYTPVIRGMWWMQGEADIVSSSYTSAYEELLTDLISDLRNDLSSIAGSDLGAMPFVLGKIYRNPDPAYSLSEASRTGVARIREAQQNVADNVFNAFAVDCTGLAQQDGWHFTADSQVWLGRQFIQQALGAGSAFQVSVVSSPYVTVTGGGIKTAGQNVTVIFNAKRGYRVTGIRYRQGMGEETAVPLSGNSYSFLMPESNVYLSFTTEELPLYTLSYTVNDGAMGSVFVSYPTAVPQGWYEGESVTIGVRPNDGYRIASVTANGTVLQAAEQLGEGYVYTVTERENVSLAVEFASIVEEDNTKPNDGTDREETPESNVLAISLISAGAAVVVVVAAIVGILIFRKRKNR